MTDADLTPTLRRATEADVQAITELVAAAYRRPRLQELELALAELQERADHLWVENVAVAPRWQCRGFGRLLLEHAEVEAASHGLGAIGLLTNERYSDNIAMYTRYGYRETHRVPHQGTDLVFFRKQLRAGAA